MSEFGDELIATRADHLAVFGETVTYKPDGGSPRQITAVVHRGRPDLVGLDGVSPLLTVHVQNDDTDGISSDEIDIGAGDAITVAERIGETARDHRITKILQQDEGMLELELRM